MKSSLLKYCISCSVEIPNRFRKQLAIITSSFRGKAYDPSAAEIDQTYIVPRLTHIPPLYNETLVRAEMRPTTCSGPETALVMAPLMEEKRSRIAQN